MYSVTSVYRQLLSQPVLALNIEDGIFIKEFDHFSSLLKLFDIFVCDNGWRKRISIVKDTDLEVISGQRSLFPLL